MMDIELFFKQLKTRVPIQAVQLSAALIQSKTEGASARLWYAEAETLSQDIDIGNRLQPLGTRERVGRQHQLLFWRGVYDLNSFIGVLETIRSGKFPSANFEIPLRLQERPAVFLVPNAPRSTLAPLEEECHWLLEFWDDEKTVRDSAGENNHSWVARVNHSVHERLGIDLSRLSDRIGNVAIFAATGIRVDWNFDKHTQCAVLHMNLETHELGDYTVELEAWEADDLTYWQRQRPQQPNVVFEQVVNFDQVRMTVWRDLTPVFRTQKFPIIKSFETHVNIISGTHGGRTYASGDHQLPARRTETPWSYWPRIRRVENDRAMLEQELRLKFYQPQSTSPDLARRTALSDLEALLARASYSVQIWDPYFGRDADDFDLLETIELLELPIRVLTSSDDWKQQHDTRSALEQWVDDRMQRGEKVEVPWLHYFEACLDHRRRTVPALWNRVAVKAWVRIGETTFHDRFLIIDRENLQSASVWLLGSSLNGLGKKHSTLVQVTRPEEIIVAFDQLWLQEGELPWGKMKHVFGTP